MNRTFSRYPLYLYITPTFLPILHFKNLPFPFSNSLGKPQNDECKIKFCSHNAPEHLMRALSQFYWLLQTNHQCQCSHHEDGGQYASISFPRYEQRIKMLSTTTRKKLQMVVKFLACSRLRGNILGNKALQSKHLMDVTQFP